MVLNRNAYFALTWTSRTREGGICMENMIQPQSQPRPSVPLTAFIPACCCLPSTLCYQANGPDLSARLSQG